MKHDRSRVVAIDGPGGSGKSSVSRGVASALGWKHLDTGAYYRAATLLVLRGDVDPDEPSAVLHAVRPHRIEQHDGVTTIDGEDVTVDIRSEAVTQLVSQVSSHPQLRSWLVRMQRLWANASGGSVVEGRDIGTVVFPEAPVKVYLTADPKERARRRAGESGASSEETESALARRDRLDSTRRSSPLQMAPDGIAVDTTGMSLPEVIDHVVSLGREAGLVGDPDASTGEPTLREPSRRAPSS